MEITKRDFLKLTGAALVSYLLPVKGGSLETQTSDSAGLKRDLVELVKRVKNNGELVRDRQPNSIGNEWKFYKIYQLNLETLEGRDEAIEISFYEIEDYKTVPPRTAKFFTEYNGDSLYNQLSFEIEFPNGDKLFLDDKCVDGNVDDGSLVLADNSADNSRYCYNSEDPSTREKFQKSYEKYVRKCLKLQIVPSKRKQKIDGIFDKILSE